MKDIAQNVEVLSPVRAAHVPDIVKSFDKEVLVHLAKWKELSTATGIPHIGLVTDAAIENFQLT